MSSENEEIVRRFYQEVLGQGRVEIADELFVADYLEHQGLGRDRPGLAAAKAWFEAIEHAFPGRVVVLEDLITQSESVVARWSLSSVYARPLMDMPPSGRQIKIGGTSVFRLSEGRIVEGWNVADSDVLMLQLRSERQPGSEGLPQSRDDALAPCGAT